MDKKEVAGSVKDFMHDIAKKDKEVVLKVKLGDEARIPIFSKIGDAGADLYSTEDISIPSMDRRVIGTGLFFEIPLGYEVQIRSRSGLAANKGVFVLNSPGTIDSGYRNEIKVILQNISKEDYVVKKGDRIAQMVLAPVCYMPFVVVDSLESSDRSMGGLGSTGV